MVTYQQPNHQPVQQPQSDPLLVNIDSRLAVLAQTVDQVAVGQRPVQRVSVVDINMSFGSMVVFMVKWAIAAIPALIILGVLAFLGSVIVTVFFAALFSR